ncbi:MAG: hypothetical protein V3T86_14400 [Planctomycetota bacterium]
MERAGLFLLFTVLVPGFVFWSGSGFAPSGDVWADFLNQVDQLEGYSEPDPEVLDIYEDLNAKDPDADEPDSATRGATEKSEPGETVPEPPKPTGPKHGWELYRAGDFSHAARVLASHDERGAALAKFADKLATAFPAKSYKGDWMKITTKSGNVFEGFVKSDLTVLRVTTIGGPELPLPKDAIASQVMVPRENAIAKAIAEIENEGLDKATKGPKLFKLVQSAFALDRPASAAKLIEHMVKRDEDEGFLAGAIQARVPKPYQPGVMRAYAAVPQTKPDPEPIVQAPKRLGNTRPTHRRKSRQLVSDRKARELLNKARPLRKSGERLYDKIFADRDKAKLKDVNAAISDFEAAQLLYGQIQEIEDSDGVAALILATGKKLARLHLLQTAIGE